MEFLSFLKVKERQSSEAKFPWNPLHDIVIDRNLWGAVVDKSKKHSINACKNFEIN